MAQGAAAWSGLWSAMGDLAARGAATAADGRRVAIFGAGMTAATWLVYTALHDAPIVGLFEHAVFQEETVVLAPGDWLIVFSDGVSEAMSAAGDEYGEERILAVVDKDTSLAPADLLKALFADVRVFTKGAPQSDDITALVLRYAPPSA